MKYNSNNYNLEEAKKLNQQAANQASQMNNKYQMEAGQDYNLMEAKKLNAQSKNPSSSNAQSSSSSSSSNY